MDTHTFTHILRQIVMVKCTHNHTHIGMINTRFRIMIASEKKEGRRNEGQSLRFLEPISTCVHVGWGRGRVCPTPSISNSWIPTEWPSIQLNSNTIYPKNQIPQVKGSVLQHCTLHPYFKSQSQAQVVTCASDLWTKDKSSMAPVSTTRKHDSLTEKINKE